MWVLRSPRTHLSACHPLLKCTASSVEIVARLYCCHQKGEEVKKEVEIEKKLNKQMNNGECHFKVPHLSLQLPHCHNFIQSFNNLSTILTDLLVVRNSVWYAYIMEVWLSRCNDVCRVMYGDVFVCTIAIRMKNVNNIGQ